MRRYARELALLGGVALTAFGACWGAHHLPRAERDDAHRLLHERLRLSAGDEARLAEVERRFTRTKAALEAAIRQANVELGNAIRQDGRYSERVKGAVETIHQAQGELQRATLEHLFDMQAALAPEQAAELNDMAAAALIHQ